jgi:two-component system phosphate regulon response regulator OmpR
MKANLLLIDDDRKMARLLETYLGGYSFKVTHAATGEDGLRALKNAEFDVVLLDVMLPGKDGFAVCRALREFSSVPVIMLTARGEVTDRVVGLELGADDYLPKPFEPRELVARIQAQLRRSQGTLPDAPLIFGPLRIDQRRREALLDGNNLQLTSMEFEVLHVFARQSGTVLNRDRLMDKLKGMDWDPGNRSLDVLLSRLRQKLGDNPKSPRWIRTVRGSCYLFLGPDHQDENS